MSKFTPQELVVRCSDMTERLMQAAGLVQLSNDMAQTLAAGLPGKIAVDFTGDKNKFAATLVSSNDDESERYRMKVSLNPGKGTVKLDNFYIVDENERGTGIGRKGLGNIYNLASDERKIDGIELTATLDHGALVWGKMGFKSHPGDFVKVQREARSRLNRLQNDLPDHAKIDPDVFEMADRLLDPQKTTDPRALWAIADMRQTIPYSYEDGQLVEKPKKLALTLLEWQEYRATLDLANSEQTSRLKSALGQATTQQAPLADDRIAPRREITGHAVKPEYAGPA